MPNKPEQFSPFTSPDISEIDTLIDNAIPKLLNNIEEVLNIENSSEISIDRATMREIITRVEKRRVYFHIYYDKLRMGELNEGALICFWILKLMPFRHATISNSTLNTKIAYTFFVRVLSFVAAETNKKVNVNKLLTDNLLYAFKYRDLSKEAIMALAEGLLYEVPSVPQEK
jgi:hypothetical protein